MFHYRTEAIETLRVTDPYSRCRCRVTVFHYRTEAIETLHVTDPYSRGLSANGERSMFVDLDRDAALMPAGWQAHPSPPIARARPSPSVTVAVPCCVAGPSDTTVYELQTATIILIIAPCCVADPSDTTVYELHVRDFSASDGSCPAHLRGTYRAFSPAATGSETDGQRHLRELADAGLNHVHLLPSYDFGSVPERPEEQMDVAVDLASFAGGARLPLSLSRSLCLSSKQVDVTVDLASFAGGTHVCLVYNERI